VDNVAVGQTPDLGQGGRWMRAKLISWKHLLFTAAVFAAFVLAAGARFKPQ
jgi:hypothetical protein